MVSGSTSNYLQAGLPEVVSWQGADPAQLAESRCKQACSNTPSCTTNSITSLQTWLKALSRVMTTTSVLAYCSLQGTKHVHMLYKTVMCVQRYGWTQLLQIPFEGMPLTIRGNCCLLQLC